MAGAFGTGAYGSSPYGSALSPVPFRVTSANSGSPDQVLVTFSDSLDLNFTLFTVPSNYSIPGLTVLDASIYDATTVRLTTSLQSYTLYTVTVAQGQSASFEPLDPLYRTATFTGTPLVPVFTPTGTRSTRIRLVFTLPMLFNAALLDPTSYTVTDVQGNQLSVLLVEPEQGATNPVSIVLTLDSPMTSAEWYVVTVAPSVVAAASGLSVEPDTLKFQWVEPVLRAVIPIGDFSGEATGGLLGSHNGLVYFSPALDVPTAGSVIQVDSVSVCTKAYDEYVPPSPPDPPALFTFDGTALPCGELNGGAVLWGAFPRLSEARVDLALTPSETMPTPVDGPCTATFTEPWDISYVALLNNPAWALFDNSSVATPPVFICANNLGPIPPGPTVTVVLQP